MRASSYILTVCLGLMALIASAQPRMKVPEYWIGAHGGVTASSVIFRPEAPYMTPITNACVLGGNAGLVFRFAAHKYCHFQMELNYQHRGWATGNDTVARTAHNMHYVELPIFMHLNFGSQVCRWFFNLGPQIGYCVWDENKSIENRFDWGLAAGTGLYVRTKHAGVYELEIRFDYSFGGIVGTGVTDKYNMASPMDLSINLGYYWPIQKKLKHKKHTHNENQLSSALRLEPDGR